MKPLLSRAGFLNGFRESKKSKLRKGGGKSNKWFLIIAFSLPLAIFSPGSAEARNKVRIGGNVVVPLAIFLAISVIGIPLIALEIFLIGIAFLVGYIAIAQLIGDKIAALMQRPALGVIWLTVMGLLALWLLSWAPFLGSLVKAVVIVLGFGGVLATLFTPWLQRQGLHQEKGFRLIMLCNLKPCLIHPLSSV